MNEVARIEKPKGLTAIMAERFQMEPTAFTAAIKKTVIQGDCSNEQLAAFLMVAHEYNLNPLTKEVYAFPSRGGIQPIVSIDGWMKLINSQKDFDGMKFSDSIDEDGQLVSVTCKIYRKDRTHPTEATEYMSECKRGTEPWKQWPRRMLRHKAAIQCARYAFSFANIMDPDEYERMVDVTPRHAETIVHDPLSDEPQSTDNEINSLSEPNSDENAPSDSSEPEDGEDVSPHSDTPSSNLDIQALVKVRDELFAIFDHDDFHAADEPDKWAKNKAGVTMGRLQNGVLSSANPKTHEAAKGVLDVFMKVVDEEQTIEQAIEFFQDMWGA